MTKGQSTTTEYRVYRRALGAIFAVLTIGGILYLLASIAVGVFGQPEVVMGLKPISAENLNEQLGCQTDVERLFHQLNDDGFRLQARVGQAPVNLMAEWEAFS